MLKRVAHTLDYGNDRFFVHVDKKTDISSFENATRDLKNVTLTKNRVRVYWGGFNSIIATMNLLDEVVNSDIRYDRIVLLQGKDYPLHSPEYIHNFFEARFSEEFCEGKNITISSDPKDYMKCCGYWSLDGEHGFFKKVFNKALSVLNCKLNIKYRKGYFRNGNEKWNVYKGWAQVAITRSFAEYLLQVYRRNQKFNKFMKHRFPPDEIYIHTILFNSPFKDKVSDYSLTPRNNAEWFDEQLNLTYFEYPITVTVFKNAEEYADLLSTKALFIRKVSSIDSMQLLNEIDFQINKEK